MRASILGGVKAEVAVVIGMGLMAMLAVVVLAAVGVKWFSGQLREHASDPRVTLVSNRIGKAETATETKTETVAATYDKGKFIDMRDSRKYKTVEIGGKVWMAENLNYMPDTGRSWCYDNREDNCKKYGRLYDWTAAMAACPSGWRLASGYDWDNLLLTIGSTRESHISSSDQFFAWEGAGNKLKAKRGWKELKDKSSGNGTDDFGFTALPGGVLLYSDETFDRLGAYANWWTATEFGDNKAAWRYVNYHRDLVVERFDNKRNGLSVRCVADSGGSGNQFDLEERNKNETLTQKDVERRDKEADETIAKLSDYFTDSRDGRIYRTVKIDSAKWMAENLNYKTPVGSWCYGGADSNCVKYGRLYEWYAAKTSCPSGWHLPSREEWDNLGKAVGGKKRPVEETGTVDWVDVGINLKAKRDWNGGIGTDVYGFSALPGGRRDQDDRFGAVGVYAYWWTAAEYRKNSAFIRFMFQSNNDFDSYLVENALFRNNGLSVRCVADK